MTTTDPTYAKKDRLGHGHSLTWRLDQQKGKASTLVYAKRNYQLTPSEQSSAQQFTQQPLVAELSLSEEEKLYQQSNIPYLMLLTLIFLVNGLILFFGSDLKKSMALSTETDQTVQNTEQPNTNWATEQFDWTKQNSTAPWQMPIKSADPDQKSQPSSRAADENIVSPPTSLFR